MVFQSHETKEIHEFRECVRRILPERLVQVCLFRPQHSVFLPILLHICFEVRHALVSFRFVRCTLHFRHRYTYPGNHRSDFGMVLFLTLRKPLTCLLQVSVRDFDEDLSRDPFDLGILDRNSYICSAVSTTPVFLCLIIEQTAFAFFACHCSEFCFSHIFPLTVKARRASRCAACGGGRIPPGLTVHVLAAIRHPLILRIRFLSESSLIRSLHSRLRPFRSPLLYAMRIP